MLVRPVAGATRKLLMFDKLWQRLDPCRRGNQPFRPCLSLPRGTGFLHVALLARVELGEFGQVKLVVRDWGDRTKGELLQDLRAEGLARLHAAGAKYIHEKAKMIGEIVARLVHRQLTTATSLDPQLEKRAGKDLTACAFLTNSPHIA